MRNTGVTKLAIVVCLLAMVTLNAPAPAHANGQVIVLGDSIAAGCCVPPEFQWAPLFASRLGAGLHHPARS